MAVTGGGRCAKGALEIMELFPFEYVEPKDLKQLYESAKEHPEKHHKIVYIVNIMHQHMVEKKELKENEKFDKLDYYKNPDEYKSIFQERYL